MIKNFVMIIYVGISYNSYSKHKLIFPQRIKNSGSQLIHYVSVIVSRLTGFQLLHLLSNSSLQSHIH